MRDGRSLVCSSHKADGRVRNQGLLGSGRDRSVSALRSGQAVPARARRRTPFPGVFVPPLQHGRAWPKPAAADPSAGASRVLRRSHSPGAGPGHRGPEKTGGGPLGDRRTLDQIPNRPTGEGQPRTHRKLGVNRSSAFRVVLPHLVVIGANCTIPLLNGLTLFGLGLS